MYANRYCQGGRGDLTAPLRIIGASRGGDVLFTWAGEVGCSSILKDSFPVRG